MRTPCFKRHAQRFPLAEQMALADHVVNGMGAQALGKWHRGRKRCVWHGKKQCGRGIPGRRSDFGYAHYASPPASGPFAHPLITSAPLGTVNLKLSGDIGGFFCIFANVSSVTLPNAS